jgi:Uma2 family endonuclease
MGTLMASPHPKLLTAEDLAQLADDDWRYDLIEGELFRMPPTGGDHGYVGSELHGHIWNHVRRHRLGKVYGAETGFYLARNPDTVIGPDVAFVRADRAPERNPGYLELVPDLAVEVRSPTDRKAYVDSKIDRYMAAGVLLLWYVDPRRQTVTVHRPGREPTTLGVGADLDGEHVLPGFRLPLAELFG